MLGYEGTIRDFFLILDGIQVFICIELTVLFFIRGFKKKKGGKVNYGWGLIFLCFGNVALMNIYLYYYLPSELWYANIKFNSLLGSIPGLMIIGIMENFYQKYRKTRFFFTIFAVSMSIFTFFTPDLLTRMLGNLSLLVLGVFVLLFYRKLIKISSGSVRKNIILFTIAFFAFIGGSLIINPTIIENQLRLGINITISGFIGRISQIFGLFIMASVLFEQPVFYEIDWRDKLVQIIIFQKKIGVHLFYKKFQDIKFKKENQREIQESLIAGGITGVSAFLKEISQSSKELKIIDHGDQKIMLEHGEYISIALSVLEELRIFWDKLYKLRVKIETIYGELLKHFDGDLKVFSPVGAMIDEIFQ